MDQLTKKKLENAQKLVDNGGDYDFFDIDCKECPLDRVYCVTCMIDPPQILKVVELAKQYIKDHKETE